MKLKTKDCKAKKEERCSIFRDKLVIVKKSCLIVLKNTVIVITVVICCSKLL